MASGAETHAEPALRPHLTALDTWALSLGCAVGWGAFVMPASTLIPLAGPVGAILAMAIGVVAMALIGRCFAYCDERLHDAGGAFTFTLRCFGHDHAFLCAWTLGLAYVAIMWANATAVVLIARYLMGPVLQVGHLFQVGGYDVYLGEVAVTLVVIVGFGLVSCAAPSFTRYLSRVLGILLLAGALGLTAAVVAKVGFGPAAFRPAFAADGRPVMGVVDVVVLAPWAFIGFESIAHSSEEIAFERRRQVVVVVAALLASALIYVATTLLSVLVVPAAYGSWPEYFAHLGELSGIDGLPAFRAVRDVLGQGGFLALCATVLAAISTSLLGLYRATSRLFWRMAHEGVLPVRLGTLDAHGNPRTAILLTMGISCFVPLVGRAAIGWIVDVTTVCAAVAYLYVAACALKIATEEGDQPVRAKAIAALVLSALFFVVPMVPSFWSVSALASESYLILAAWAVLGLLVFWFVLRSDDKQRFGKSTVVWIALLFLIFFASTMWMRQATDATSARIVSEMDAYHEELHERHGVPITPEEDAEEDRYIQGKTDELRHSLLDNSLLQLGLIAFGLAIMFNIYSLMGKRQTELEAQRLAAQESSQAKTMFLSNVSHDIRTPMNAIVGYTKLAQDERLDLAETRAYLAKIDAASAYMLTLVNDVLEMGRIESGRMDLAPVECNLVAVMDALRDLFSQQMSERGIAFSVDTSEVRHALVLCDHTRLDSVLLNIVGNAYKFTQSGGLVRVGLRELGEPEGGVGRYELEVSDTGIGMSEEFAARIFEPFERERTTTVSGIQGTGLGMSITKSIVDLMGGTIEVKTAQGKGTTFRIELPLELVGDGIAAAPEADAAEDPTLVLAGRRVLMAEDNEINREIATLVLEDMGLEVECAENGYEAVQMVEASEPGYYDAVLMDVRMPVMGGYEATRQIRALADERLASIPIIAITANAFAEDVADAFAAGMDAHLAKPLDVSKAERVLADIIASRT